MYKKWISLVLALQMTAALLLWDFSGPLRVSAQVPESVRPVSVRPFPAGAAPSDEMGYRGKEYQHVPDSYPVNKAKSYFFYDQLSGDCRAIYDAMLDVAGNLYARQYSRDCQVSLNPASQEFSNLYSIAFKALEYDHPELFWIFRNDGVSMFYSYLNGQTGSDYTVTFYLQGVTSVCEQQIIAFNQNTRKFLNLVDLGGSQEDMARQIHDLLVHNVNYDDDCFARIADKSNYCNKAYSAYGAMVTNTAGQPFTAVCSGYSLAFLYLLQQVGIEATIVEGFTGDRDDTSSAHAWNLVKLGGSWHEVDVTWDDVGSQLDNVDPGNLVYYQEALADPDFYDRSTHAMFCISTAEISNFTPSPDLSYHSKDGRLSLTFFGSSTRHRARNTPDYPTRGELMELVPVAG